MPAVRRGRAFIQLPGPTSIPDAVLRAMHEGATDFAAPAFIDMARGCLDDLRGIFQTAGEVYAFSANGHGGWEVALANLFRSGERILVPDTGRFATAWQEMAECLGIEVVTIPTDLRTPVDPAGLAAALEADRAHRIAAVCLVQVETSTGMLHDVAAARAALDTTGHPALLVVDAIASLACIDLPMDAWGVDLAIAASQKGLMLPAGLAFVGVGPRAQARAQEGGGPRRYWDWRSRQGSESYLWFYGTPPTQMMAGLRVAIDMLKEEGLPAVFARHRRLADAARAAVARWAEAGALSFQTIPPEARSDTVTAIRFPASLDPEAVRRRAREELSVSLGGGLGPLQGRVLRIGHLGDLNEPMLLGSLATLELALQLEGVPIVTGGVEAAIASLARVPGAAAGLA